jgi:hypothetical protein
MMMGRFIVAIIVLMFIAWILGGLLRGRRRR